MSEWNSLSCVPLFATSWTVQSMEFSRPGYWSGVGSLSLLQGDLPNPGIEPRSPILQAYSLPAEPQGKPKYKYYNIYLIQAYIHMCVCAQLFHSCPTLCDPMDFRLPGSSLHGIFPARILEWVAMPSSRGSSWPSDQICVSCIASRFFTAEPPGKPIYI